MFLGRKSKPMEMFSQSPSGESSSDTASQAREELLSRLEKHESLTPDLRSIEELNPAGIPVPPWAKLDARCPIRKLPPVNQGRVVVEVFDPLKVTGVFDDLIFIAPCGF